MLNVVNAECHLDRARFMLSVTNKPFLLSVVTLIVVETYCVLFPIDTCSMTSYLLYWCANWRVEFKRPCPENIAFLHFISQLNFLLRNFIPFYQHFHMSNKTIDASVIVLMLWAIFSDRQFVWMVRNHLVYTVLFYINCKIKPNDSNNVCSHS